MYKAIFIDIDGTLVKSDHTISEATLAVIQKLKKKNILVVLVSARPLYGILPVLDATGLLGYPVASLNGAYIISNETVLFNSIIDIATTLQVYEQLQKYEATIICYEQVQWFSEFRDISTDYEQKITSIPITIQPFADTLQYWRYKNTGPNKIQVIANAGVINEIQSNLKQRFISHLNVCTSEPRYLEVINIKTSKINAVRLLIDHYNIKREEIIAIGDNFNDMEMIAFAGIGIAMGNAPVEVQAVAKYITDTNNNDGVAKGIIKFIDL